MLNTSHVKPVKNFVCSFFIDSCDRALSHFELIGFLKHNFSCFGIEKHLPYLEIVKSVVIVISSCHWKLFFFYFVSRNKKSNGLDFHLLMRSACRHKRLKLVSVYFFVYFVLQQDVILLLISCMNSYHLQKAWQFECRKPERLISLNYFSFYRVCAAFPLPLLRSSLPSLQLCTALSSWESGFLSSQSWAQSPLYPNGCSAQALPL